LQFSAAEEFSTRTDVKCCSCNRSVRWYYYLADTCPSAKSM